MYLVKHYKGTEYTVYRENSLNDVLRRTSDLLVNSWYTKIEITKINRKEDVQ